MDEEDSRQEEGPTLQFREVLQDSVCQKRGRVFIAGTGLWTISNNLAILDVFDRYKEVNKSNSSLEGFFS